MNFVTFNPALVTYDISAYAGTTAPAPTVAFGWSVAGLYPKLKHSDSEAELVTAFSAPAATRALTVEFTAFYRPTGNGHPDFGEINVDVDPSATVVVSRASGAEQSFKLFNSSPFDDYWIGAAGYGGIGVVLGTPPDGYGPYTVSLDIDVVGLDFDVNGTTGTITPPDPIAVDDDIVTVTVRQNVPDHVYVSGYGRESTSFTVRNLVIKGPGEILIPPFWTSYVGTKETL